MSHLGSSRVSFSAILHLFPSRSTVQDPFTYSNGSGTLFKSAALVSSLQFEPLFQLDASIATLPTMSSTSDAPSAPPVSIPRPQANTILTSFTSFLTLTVHTILYHRRLYPQQTFLMTKAHNLPVPQSRHPVLCDWINSAVAAIQDQLAIGAASKVCVVIHAHETMAVIERWVFDVTNFPAWATGKGKEKIGMGQRFQRREEDDDDGSVNWVDVNEAYRGALRRLAYAAEMKGPLPEGCTFTMAVELRDEAPAPIGHPQPWIPSEPSLQPASRTNPVPGVCIGGASTTPLRSVEAGPLFFECWIEESKPPSSPHSTQDSYFS
ncbi:HORMA domain-containing protein [Colletotrichum higginsianum IMI 349063]|uniref:HORMA domain-containing protein n=3 Tax=Colletotrichum higginsianum TaxID=80884 RepID=A0A1B7XRI7_COLHI|nr:HORMA domain-containing protein [Colletotrichum higginsianum IMI 349063]OBR02371.1 HORMA domain-containing protein [Colletotrichum higginsianum IMI 349063]